MGGCVAQVSVVAPGIVTVVDLDSSGAQVGPLTQQHARAHHIQTGQPRLSDNRGER